MANSTSCNFSSITEVIAQADAGKLNITTIVASCQGICTLAWGTGNPDLSGIGINISYIFQAVLTFIFGPLFCLIFKYWENGEPGDDELWEFRAPKSRFKERTQKNLEDLQDTFMDVCAQFSITVAVAAVVRFRQHAPFYETAFLRSLTTMQLLSLLSSAVITGIPRKRKDWERITVICLYGIIDFAFYMGLIGGLVASQASWETISELSDSCAEYGKIVPGYEHIPKAHVHLPHLSAKQIFLGRSGASWRFNMIIFGLSLAGAAAFVVAACIIFCVGYLLTRKNGPILGTMSLAFAIGTIVELVEMERTRGVMKEVTGPDFEDNQWGFGQVIALLLWVPLCVQVIYYGIREFFQAIISDFTSEDANRV